jgi:hypothetical protein
MYRAVIFRREYPMLGEIIDRSQQLYSKLYPEAEYLKNEHTWTFPSGAKVMFRHLQNEVDKYDYSGQQFSFIGFDELTQFTFTQYMFMWSRCRSADPDIRCYIRSTTNPKGVGHAWVKARFIDAAPPRTTISERYKIPELGIEVVLDRCFIPARVWDNRKLLGADPAYAARLMQLPEADRKALLEGDWDAFEGQVFRELNRDVHIIEPFEIPADWPRMLSVDWGYAKPYSVGWWAFDPEGVAIRYRELYGYGGEDDLGTYEDAELVARKVAKISLSANELQLLGPGVGDPAMWEQKGTGRSVALAFRDEGLYLYPGINDRVNGKMQLHWRLATTRYDPGNPGADEAGLVPAKPRLVVFNTCVHWIRTLPLLQYDPVKVEDVDSRSEDHAYDETRYLCMTRPIAAATPVVRRPVMDGPLVARKRRAGGRYLW